MSNINDLISKDIINNNFSFEKNELNKNIIISNDFEINSLDYKNALQFDKRTYIQYYISLIRKKKQLIFTFYTSNDYNLKSLKIALLFFSFALYFTLNSLFFNDATMHKIYTDEGNYNFIYQIPNIIYSSIICSVINTIFTTLSLTEQLIVGFKRIKSNIEQYFKKLIKCIIIKFISFFILSFIFLIFFWYYLSCFCAVYKNTQIHLIKDTLISFGLSLLYPLFFCLLPGIFRIPSLKAQKQNRECIYKISRLLQLI